MARGAGADAAAPAATSASASTSASGAGSAPGAAGGPPIICTLCTSRSSVSCSVAPETGGAEGGAGVLSPGWASADVGGASVGGLSIGARGPSTSAGFCISGSDGFAVSGKDAGDDDPPSPDVERLRMAQGDSPGAGDSDEPASGSFGGSKRLAAEQRWTGLLGFAHAHAHASNIDGTFLLHLRKSSTTADTSLSTVASALFLPNFLGLSLPLSRPGGLRERIRLGLVRRLRGGGSRHSRRCGRGQRSASGRFGAFGGFVGSGHT